MTAQNVASLLYDIKQKITDKEFKDIMDALGGVHKNEEKKDVYLFKYYKMKMDVRRLHDGQMGNRLKYKYKERKVVLHEDTSESNINRFMNNVKHGIDYEFVIDKYHTRIEKREYPVLNTACKTIKILESMDDYDRDEEDKKPVILEYNQIIPISIEKL